MLNDTITPEFISYITKVVYNAAGPHNLNDHVQDALLRICEQSHLYNPDKGSFRTWAATVASNYTRNRWKREKIRTNGHVTSVKGKEDDKETPVYDTLVAPTDERADDRKLFAAALEMLTGDERTLMEMVLEGRGQTEIAAALGITQGAVSKRITKTQDRIRLMMQEAGR